MVYGLISHEQHSETPFILSNVSMTGKVVGSGAEITIKQTYHNTFSKVIQNTEYRFPLDENSAVSGFQAEFDGKTVVGVVKEKSEAKKEYNDAVSSGYRASLLEQKQENDFTCYIGNIPVSGTCVVTISYITTLDQEGCQNVLTLPISMAAKYGEKKQDNDDNVITSAPWDKDTPCQGFFCDGCDMRPILGERFKCTQCTDYDLCQTCHDTKVHQPADHTFQSFDPYRNPIVRKRGEDGKQQQQKVHFEAPLQATLNVEVVCENILKSQLVSIDKESQYTDRLVKTVVGNDVVVSMTTQYQKNSLLPDLRILIDYENPDQAYHSQLFIETTNNTDINNPRMNAMQLMFVPKSVSPQIAAMQLRSEYIFILDCSGSMGGTSMEALKNVMLLILAQLPVKCKFNIYAFGSSYNKLFQKSQLLTDDTLLQAKTFITKMGADLGGTEIMPPLDDALKQGISNTYPRQVFLVTDGQVSNVDQLENLIHQHIHTTRVFTIGMGYQVDRSLIKRLAVAGYGTHEFVPDSKNINEPVIRQLHRSNQSCFLNATIDWNRQKATQGIITTVPRKIPALYPNSTRRVILYGIAGDDYAIAPTSITGDIIIKGHSNMDTEITMRDDQPNNDTWTIPYSSAIYSRVVSGSYGVVSKLAARAQIRELEHMKDQTDKDRLLIKNIALTYQLMSSQTSFIVVDKSTNITTNLNEPQARDSIYRLSTESLTTDASIYFVDSINSIGCVAQCDSLSVMESKSMRLESQSATFQFQSRSTTQRPSFAGRLVSGAKSMLAKFGSRGSGVPASNEDNNDDDAGCDRGINVSTRGSNKIISGNSSKRMKSISDSHSLSRQQIYDLLLGQQALDGTFKFDQTFKDILLALNTSFEKLRVIADQMSQKNKDPVLLSDQVLTVVIALSILRNNYSDKQIEWTGVIWKSQHYLDQFSNNKRTIEGMLSTPF